MPIKLVAKATSLEGSKNNNFRSFIYSHSSTIPANWVKIGPADVQIKGLTESLKKNHEHFISTYSGSTAGRANNEDLWSSRRENYESAIF